MKVQLPILQSYTSLCHSQGTVVANLDINQMVLQRLVVEEMPRRKRTIVCVQQQGQLGVCSSRFIVLMPGCWEEMNQKYYSRDPQLQNNHHLSRTCWQCPWTDSYRPVSLEQQLEFGQWMQSLLHALPQADIYKELPLH